MSMECIKDVKDGATRGKKCFFEWRAREGEKLRKKKGTTTPVISLLPFLSLSPTRELLGFLCSVGFASLVK
jgi:hypothetical protein